MAHLAFTDADIAEIRAVLDRLAATIGHLELVCAPEHDGRSRDWSVEGMLAAWLLVARHHDTFHLDRAETANRHLTPGQRRQLGCHRQDGTPYTGRQISYAWNLITRAVDPARHRNPDERTSALEAMQLLTGELLAGTIPRDVRRAWKGDIAVDATIVATYSRPAPADQDYDRTAHPYAEAITNPAPRPAEHRDGRRRRWDRKRRPVGADWTGHHDRFGYAHHVAVLAPDVERTTDLPPVAVGLITAPASAHPARAARPLVEAVAAQRDHAGDTTGPALGDVLADAGYSQAHPADWNLAGVVAGGQPIFRLHATNQEGHRRTNHQAHILMIDGHPYCACMPQPLRDLTRPTAVDDHAGRARHRRDIEPRAGYAYQARHTARNTSLRFQAPHTGGCGRCAGQAARDRCCQKKTVCIPWADLGTYQRERYGTAEWERSYNRRNRIEGFFGIAKSTAGGAALHHNSARFWEYGKVTVAATLCAMAANLYLVDLWRRRQEQRTDRGSADAPTRGRPRLHGTLQELADRAAPQPRPEKKVRSRVRDPFANLRT